MPEIQIGGLVSFTTIDFPGKLACVLFLNGCPLRCAYCSNPHLLEYRSGEYDPEKIYEWLKTRVGKLEGVVFSGGEALMQGTALIDYMRRVKELGFSIGLHTNGFYPATLRRAADVVDWVGLDYKATRERYRHLVGNDVAYDNMTQSLDFWTSTGRGLEVRITCDPRFVTIDDVREIARDAAARGAHHLAIQKYTPHFEDAENPTTPAAREQFFRDDGLRMALASQFETVIWRE